MGYVKAPHPCRDAVLFGFKAWPRTSPLTAAYPPFTALGLAIDRGPFGEPSALEDFWASQTKTNTH